MNRIITATQKHWLEVIGRRDVGPRNWAGCPYSVFDALERKGLVLRTAAVRQSRQWDTYTLTDAGRAALSQGAP